jgi:pimeloyl-ACP methyl ester carboxylesterase
LNVRRFGERGGTPFVFWHALGPDTSGAYFEEVGEALGRRGYDVHAVDGPGFGESPALAEEDYRLVRLAELVDGLGLERPVVAGHSWGGAVAVTYAGLHPENVRALVLFDSGHIDYRELADVDPSRRVDDVIAEIRTRPDPRNAEGRALAMCGLTDPVSGAWPVIAEHRIPTLLFLATMPPHGDQNREHIGRFETAVPHADVRWLDGATHGIFGEVGDERLAVEIAAFLE